MQWVETLGSLKYACCGMKPQIEPLRGLQQCAGIQFA
jgi:hypothetical protein